MPFIGSLVLRAAFGLCCRHKLHLIYYLLSIIFYLLSAKHRRTAEQVSPSPFFSLLGIDSPRQMCYTGSIACNEINSRES